MADHLPYIQDGPLAEYAGKRLRGQYAFITQRKEWFCNTGPVWQPVSDEAVREHVRHVLKDVFFAKLNTPEFETKQLTPLLNRAKTDNVAALLRGILPMDYAAFDQHPDHLNTPSGVVDLRTGMLLPHSDKFLFTAMTNADYRPDATSKNWTKALDAVPVELHDYMQIVVGQAITGYPPDDDKVRFLQGGGENGKSSFLDAIRLALGGFAGPVPDKVMVSRPDEHPTELLELRGKRLVVLEEMPQGARVSTKRLKDVAGTAELNARPLYGKTVVWKATHTMFVTSNHRPLIPETDHGTWRRLEMVVFPYRFVRGKGPLGPDERRGSPALRTALRSKPDPAVLAWLVVGAQRWYTARMRLPDPPPLVVAATDAWRAQADDVLRFVSEHLEFDPVSTILGDDLRRMFDAWCDANNKQRWANQTFAERFEDHPVLRDRGATRARLRVDSVAVSRPPGFGRTGPRLKVAGVDAPTGQRRVWRGLRWQEGSP